MAFFEFYISIQTLEKTFCPGVNVTARKGLFNELTEKLDYAVLRSLAKTQPWRKRPISLNINLSGLSTPEFEAFDAVVGDLRNRVILEINKADLIGNMGEYKRLAKGLGERGYVFCLDALDAVTLPHLDLNGLGLGYAKLYWDDTAAHASEATKKALADRIGSTPKVRWVMAHCDDTAAFNLAGALGIALVQGKLVDQMVKKGIPV